ncbi:HEAT repeat domain-containing protein [Thermodesulfobacteriota bacterium]
MRIFKYISLVMLLIILSSCQQEEFISVEMLKNKAMGGDKSAIKKLIVLFSADDIETKSDAYKAILEVKEGAVETLIEELDSADGDRSEYIIAALGMIRNKKAVDKIIDVLKSDKGRRYVAAFALGQINDNKGTRALIEALDDVDAEVKRYAAISITKNPKGDKSGADKLDVVGELIKFLGRQDVSDKTFALSVIGELKDKRAVDAVIKEVDGKFKEQALWALGKLKDERAVDVIVKKLSHSDWKIRVAAARSLGSIHSEKAVAEIEKNLEDENVFVREWAARALEDITGKDYKYKRENGEYEIPTSLYR